MKTLKTAIAAIAVLGFAGAAHAQDGQAYVNVGVDTLEFDQYGIGGKLGYQFSDYFGVEAQGSIGIIDDEVTLGGTTVDVGYDYLIGGFATGTLPLGESVDLIGRVGYYAAEVSAEVTAGGIGASDDEDGFAFGAGLQYMWDDLNGVRADYTYLDGDGGHADAVSLSYVRKF